MLFLCGIIGDKSMNSYTTNSDEYKKIYLILAVLSILSAYGLGKILFLLNINLWWIDYPSVAGFYGIYFYLFDHHLWNKSILTKIKLVKTPNLNGQWEGFIESSYDDFKSKKDVIVNIIQTWTKICIKLQSEQSRSKSEVCGIVIEENGEATLVYSYISEPISKAPQTMNIHEGTISFFLNKDQNELAGDYYTGRDRKNYGTISLKRGRR